MGATFAYQTKRRNRVKLVFWEGSDVCLLAKPLAGAETLWTVADEDIRLAPAQLSALFNGVDWRRSRKLMIGASNLSR
jgi:transposase